MGDFLSDSEDENVDLGGNANLRVQVTAPALAEELGICYWTAAEREIRIMIFFYMKQLTELFPGQTVYENDLGDLSMDNFKRVFKLWSSGNRLPEDFDAENLYLSAKEKARAHYNIDFKLRRARHLLQSSGFLDIDLVYDHTAHFSASYQQHQPLVEVVKSTGSEQAFRAVTCGICHLSIRSPLYFECKHNNPCKDSETHKFPVGVSKGNLHRVTKCKNVQDLPQANFRFCPLCAPRLDDRSFCDIAHLVKVWPEEDHERNVDRFKEHISRAEDIAFQAGRHYGAAMKIISHLLQTDGRLFKMGRLEVSFKDANWLRLVEWISTLSTPAGLFHIGLMFGPLMIENGVGLRGEEESFGAYISPRAPPSLFSKHKDILPSIDPRNDHPGDTYHTKVLSLYKDKFDKKTYMSSRMQPIGHRGDRPTVAVVKRVYGGAFSGHIPSKSKDEKRVLETFIAASESCMLEGKMEHRQQEIQNAAKLVVEQLRCLIGHEVKLHLTNLASRLMGEDMVLKWHPRRNSCQQFAEKLLDGDNFEHLFPLFPRDFTTHESVRKNPEFQWPRYLISFNDHIDGIAALNFQPKSVFSKYCQDIRDRCDIIDYLQLKIVKADRKKLKRKKEKSLHIRVDKLFSRASDSNILKQYGEFLLTHHTDDGRIIAGGEVTEELVNVLWELPRDTISLIQFHLLRSSAKYSNDLGKPLSVQEWVRNRLRLFRQYDLFASLAGGFGAAVIEVLSNNPHVLKSLVIPHARVYGTAHASEKMIFGIGPFVLYIVQQGRQAILDYIKGFVKKSFSDMKPFFERKFGHLLHSGRASKLWHALKLYENLLLVAYGNILKPFVFGPTAAITDIVLKSVKASIMDKRGWQIADVNGTILVMHLRKKMRSSK